MLALILSSSAMGAVSMILKEDVPEACCRTTLKHRLNGMEAKYVGTGMG